MALVALVDLHPLLAEGVRDPLRLGGARLVDHHLAGDHGLLAGHRLLAPHRDADGALLEGPGQVGLGGRAGPARPAARRAPPRASAPRGPSAARSPPSCGSPPRPARRGASPPPGAPRAPAPAPGPRASTTCSRAAPRRPGGAPGARSVRGAHLTGEVDPVALQAVDGGELVLLPLDGDRVGRPSARWGRAVVPRPAIDLHARAEFECRPPCCACLACRSWRRSPSLVGPGAPRVARGDGGRRGRTPPAGDLRRQGTASTRKQDRGHASSRLRPVGGAGPPVTGPPRIQLRHELRPAARPAASPGAPRCSLGLRRSAGNNDCSSTWQWSSTVASSWSRSGSRRPPSAGDPSRRRVRASTAACSRRGHGPRPEPARRTARR